MPPTEALRETQPLTDVRPTKKPYLKSLPRPGVNCHPIVDMFTSVDHKKIGILYGVFALFFFLVGGFEALLLRTQLMSPENDFISASTYNELFTMHGTTMIFLAVMPLSAAFFNYFTPLQIGARDVAFPRMNALSLWTFFFGGVLLNLTWLFEAPAIGWFGYAPLSGDEYSPGVGPNFWVLALQVLGISSLVGSFNFITTVINMRAPGMKFMRMPVFVWMTFVTSILIVLALPAISVALFQLMFDRLLDTHFFDASFGGKPILWQHLFWVFGHPEVYILILPAMGIISEILPTFSRKPLFGYPITVFSGAVIGFLGFTVWSHHMFTTGMGVVATTAFSIMTMLISIPTGVKIFNWIGTMWGGQIRFTAPSMFAIGFIAMFMMGGFTGVMHAAVPGDAQQHDTYFVVAHFHYVLIGGSIFALIGGVYYWFPKIAGRMMNDAFGKLVFWLVMIGFNLAFFPMHFIGLAGQPRRTHTYLEGMGLSDWNWWSTVGAFILGGGILLFVIQIIYSVYRGKPAGKDPWDARTVEWMTDNPPKPWNFDKTPVIRSRDQFWEDKYGNEEEHSDTIDEGAHGIHMPDRSWYPFLTAFGLFLVGFGMVFFNNTIPYVNYEHQYEIALIGGVVTLLSIIGWALEGPGGYHVHPEKEEQSQS